MPIGGVASARVCDQGCYPSSFSQMFYFLPQNLVFEAEGGIEYVDKTYAAKEGGGGVDIP